MECKEKADELFNKFYSIYSEYDLTSEEILVSSLAIKSSLVLVEEMLLQESLLQSDDEKYFFIEFWNGVKDELNLR